MRARPSLRGTAHVFSSRSCVLQERLFRAVPHELKHPVSHWPSLLQNRCRLPLGSMPGSEKGLRLLLLASSPCGKAPARPTSHFAAQLSHAHRRSTDRETTKSTTDKTTQVRTPGGAPLNFSVQASCVAWFGCGLKFFRGAHSVALMEFRFFSVMLMVKFYVAKSHLPRSLVLAHWVRDVKFRQPPYRNPYCKRAHSILMLKIAPCPIPQIQPAQTPKTYPAKTPKPCPVKMSTNSVNFGEVCVSKNPALLF